MRSGLERWTKRLPATLVCALAVFLAIPAPSQAADPGRWVETGFSQIPSPYYQGVTSDPGGNLYFDGYTVGLYRTTSALVEEARVPNAIPPEVQQREGYNHIGDLTWDAAEGGRLLLPLECFRPGRGNFCRTGSIGVVDPASLAWRYYVKLDPADILKAMWAEVSPDRELLWTSAGRDLLAYRTSDVAASNSAPAGPLLRPVRRLVGAVPPSGVTGATFYEGWLFLAGQDGGPFQVWSIDVETGERNLEMERQIFGESEGLDVFEGFGGLLHWQIGEISFSGPPTYGFGHTALVHFVPANRPPDCSAVRADPTRLWPPNHELRLVTLSGATDPDGDTLELRVTGVTQDEPVDGRGDGHTSPDAVAGLHGNEIWIRAERSGGGDGRVYEIAFTATDPREAACSGAVTVTVPRNRGKTGKRS